MKKIIMPAMALVVLLPCLAGTLGLQVDLTGWWTNLEDNNHMIKIEQHGSDVAISGTNQPVVNGTFINDTLWVFLTDPAPDTVVLVYANDTLRGLSEEGHPLTLVRYVVDLSGWWKDLKSGDVLKMQQQSSDVIIWGGEDSSFSVNGAFVNDTLLIFLLPPLTPDPDTMVMVYTYDILSGLNPDGDSMILVRLPYGLWAPIRCGTITVDGYGSDWEDSCMVAVDLDNDATNGNPSADFNKLFLCHDSTYLYIRVDCVGDIAFPHSGDYADRYSIFLGRYMSGRFEYLVRFWNSYAINFRNNVTGQETTLGAPGVEGHILEGRIPLYLLEHIDKAEISVESEYDGEFGWAAYDEIELLAKPRPCLCGDANGNGLVNVDDAVHCVNYIFKGGPAAWPLDAGDANGDHIVNIGDAVYVINYIFRGGPAPCCP